jgi:PIN domain nuclease of toxin-antitoxin system
MKFLIDSHTAIWFFEGVPKLGGTTRALITNSSDDTSVSLASVWELAIKVASGKLRLKRGFDEYVLTADFFIVPITLEQIRIAAKLPFIHRDPFDRLLIAQAMSENLTLITGDTDMLKYPDVKLLDARK